MLATEEYTPEYMPLYERPRHYMGATYYGTYVVYGVHRDSGLIEQSNWQILERDFGDRDGVFITRASHWAVGWVETMRVDPEKASAETLRELDECVAAIESYPVLDDGHHSALETEEVTRLWTNASLREKVYYCQRAGVSVFSARSEEFPEDPSGMLFQLLRDW